MALKKKWERENYRNTVDPWTAQGVKDANPPQRQKSESTVTVSPPYLQIQPTMDHVVLYHIFNEKYLQINVPVQFTLVLFKGQLYLKGTNKCSVDSGFWFKHTNGKMPFLRKIY